MPRQFAQISNSSKLIIPGIFGNMLEIYDFVLYGYFAPILAKLFFPATNKVLSLLTTFGVFALGFLMRPLGAIIFGHFGDRIGRKKALSASIILIAVPTTLMGLLPTYEQIGAFAPLLLMLCRLLQGLAVGGEFTGSIIYVTEHAPADRRGLYGSFAMLGTYAGILIGSAVSAVVSNFFSITALHGWGWRIPFVMSFLLGIIGLYLRLRMPETPTFLTAQIQQRVVKNPLFYAFKTVPILMIIVLILNFLPSVGFYTLFVYLSSYMTVFLKVPLHIALTINTISMLGIVVVIPFIGLLSDRVGRKPILITGALCFIIFTYPLFLLLSQGSFIFILLAQVCFAIFIAFTFAALPAMLVELMATNIRYTAISFPYNLASAVFGGTSPLVATYLIKKTGNHLSPSYYLILAGILMLFAIFTTKESYRKITLAREAEVISPKFKKTSFMP